MASTAPTAPPRLGAVRDRLLADAGLRGRAFTEAWTAQVDAVLISRFERELAERGGIAAIGPVALVAVGGYGRGDLSPYSDLDLIVLAPEGARLDGLPDATWYPIWDDGLKLGHALRTPQEAIDLAAVDRDTATSLLTARHLAGDAETTAAVTDEVLAVWRSADRRSLTWLRDAAAERRRRGEEVAFLLEPDLKEGRGGLRDLHSLAWAQRARPVLQPGDVERLTEAEDLFTTVRVELHRLTRRPGDRLTLQSQDEIARALDRTAEELMAEVSAAARTVSWVADEAWHRVDLAQASSLSLLGWRSRSRAPGLAIRAGEVFLDASVDPASDPQSALKVALLAAQKDARPARSTLSRLVERLAPMPEPWPDDARRRFIDLLACGRDALPVIEALDQVRLWERMIPEWQPARSRPQRNAYHRYTVDRHLLEATANAAALQYRTDRPDLLLVGTLLHDIGKGYPGDHTDVGCELVRTIATRMGFDAADQDVLVDMVRYHLLLPDVATRRDLSDDATISHVAQEVRSTLLLDLLYSLTEADSLATGPAAWGTWKAGLVRELVHRTDQVLLGASADVMTESEFPTDEHRELLAAGRTVVRGRDTTLLAVAPDRPGLLSRVAGALSLHGLDVLSADAYAEDGMAVEQFEVTSSFGPMIAWDRVEPDVERAIGGRLALDARLDARAEVYADRRRPNLPPPVVRFDDDASGTATVVEVLAPDAIGLLYRVTRVFASFELDLRTAKVQTLGDQVVDAFYLTHPGGELVTDPDLRVELDRAIRHALG